MRRSKKKKTRPRVDVPSPFAAVLREMLAADAGTKQSFALAVGLTSSAISRMLHAGELPSAMVCLRLARHTHRPPSPVLRAAGHHAFADLLDELYGVPPETAVRPSVLSPADERFHLTYTKRLSQTDLRAVKIIIKRMAGVVEDEAHDDEDEDADHEDDSDGPAASPSPPADANHSSIVGVGPVVDGPRAIS